MFKACPWKGSYAASWRRTHVQRDGVRLRSRRRDQGGDHQQSEGRADGDEEEAERGGGGKAESGEEVGEEWGEVEARLWGEEERTRFASLSFYGFWWQSAFSPLLLNFGQVSWKEILKKIHQNLFLGTINILMADH